jgi:hypothetical protein
LKQIVKSERFSELKKLYSVNGMLAIKAFGPNRLFYVSYLCNFSKASSSALLVSSLRARSIENLAPKYRFGVLGAGASGASESVAMDGAVVLVGHVQGEFTPGGLARDSGSPQGNDTVLLAAHPNCIFLHRQSQASNLLVEFLHLLRSFVFDCHTAMPNELKIREQLK